MTDMDDQLVRIAEALEKLIGAVAMQTEALKVQNELLRDYGRGGRNVLHVTTLPE